jgi:hypothetical protein
MSDRQAVPLDVAELIRAQHTTTAHLADIALALDYHLVEALARLELIAAAVDWLARDRPRGMREWGRYYGYPDCCIEAFVQDCPRPSASLRPRHPDYGYVMCEACAADLERRERMAAESWPRRQAPLAELDKADV